MQRVLELIREVVAAHPNDRFFSEFDSRFQASPLMRTYYRAYESAFKSLEPDSWTLLKRKAINHFMDYRVGQLKQGFFNQLNEAFAYQFLVRRGCTNVRLIPEDGSIRPDISYLIQSDQKYCEVKTVCISQNEIACRSAVNYSDRSHYTELSSGFLRKLRDDLGKALDQIASQGANGLVFVVVGFDDFSLTHYQRYRRQLVASLLDHEAPEVFVKIGIYGRRHIHKSSVSLNAKSANKNGVGVN